MADVAATPAPGEVTALRTEAVAATCAQCHGTSRQALIPPLAGRPAAATIAAMRAYRADTRPGGLMPQLALGYDDTQIVRIAEWFAAQPSAVPRR